MNFKNKLFLITATLGIMAVGSATAFAGDAYIYINNNSNETLNIQTNWKSNGTCFHRYVSSCYIRPGAEGYLEVGANDSNHDACTEYSHLHIKIKSFIAQSYGDCKAGSADIANVEFSAGYSVSSTPPLPNLCGDKDRDYFHMCSASIGTSAPAELNRMSLHEQIQGGITSRLNNYNDTTTQPGRPVYGIITNGETGNAEAFALTITFTGGINSSPLGKLKTFFKNI